MPIDRNAIDVAVGAPSLGSANRNVCTGTYEPFAEGVEVIRPLDAMWESELSQAIARMIDKGPVRVTWKVEMAK